MSKQENNRKLRKAFEDRALTMDASPNFIILDTISFCNIKCRMCWQVKLDNVQHPRCRQSDKAIAEVVSIKDNLGIINLHGTGEPLLREDLPDICAKFKSVGCPIEVCTNGKILTAKTFLRFVEAGLSTLRISCDGDNKKTMEYLREGIQWESYLENVKAVVEVKRRKNIKTKIGFNTIVSGYNWRELPGIVKLAESLGLNFVAIFAYIPMGDGVEELFVKKEHIQFVRDFVVEHRKKKGGITLFLINAFDPDKPLQDENTATSAKTTDAPVNRNRCKAVYSMMCLQAEGSVNCCDINTMVMGNLNDNTIMEIWNGPVYQQLRKDLNEGNPPECCRVCYCGLRDTLER